MAEFILSAFADEAGGGLLSQIAALKDNGFTHIEPRGLDAGNISEFTAAQAKEVRQILDANGIGVSSVGSYFGKINIEDDFTAHFELFKQCVENACILGTKNIRMFSFYMPKDKDPAVYRDEVFARLEKMADCARASDIWCCHENEKGIFGDNDERCLDILKTFEGKMKGIFDPANFIQCGVEILPAYEKLKDYIEYMHVKDCRMSDGFVVPCGKGDGHIEELLSRFKQKDGKRFLTLEPHLKVFAGLEALEQNGGADSVKEEFEYPTNRDAFNAACDALHAILARI
ncbi:MAG: sugar phosphate isomerase/epimerase [Clostridia bacterium]|nr:sugar phosphate isomerase/epimerase [Clostridia bacterium]MBR0508662.1 sugar phosphate isomerase/epimerase [Clostridia bacterium]MBR0537464.1 sugar phosphate isomerase/epimerase [Clostridia bacterium]